jgi:bifunctional ADP-heptose synthase (sugar kinase/adenylyltransferase)
VAAVRPDVHAKGTDYTVASVPEAETARSVGSEVVIAGDDKTHASGAVIQLVVERFGSRR